MRIEIEIEIEIEIGIETTELVIPKSLQDAGFRALSWIPCFPEGYSLQTVRPYPVYFVVGS